MRFILSMFASMLVLSGCAETFLTQSETSAALSKATNTQTHQDVHTLRQISQKAAALAYSYLNAANKTTTVQEVSAGIAIVSAAATAQGLVTGASDRVLANRAIPGISSTIVATRYGSQATIQAIYAGAKRLNCISGAAGIADGIGNLKAQETAAVAATRAAMLDAQIKTRTELVRNNPSFDGFLEQFTGGLAQPTSDLAASRTVALDEYIRKLAVCVEIQASENSPASPESGNPDIPNETPESEPDQSDNPEGNLVQN